MKIPRLPLRILIRIIVCVTIPTLGFLLWKRIKNAARKAIGAEDDFSHRTG